MQSPTKNYTKKARKPSSTFSHPTTQTDVGDFKGGYFVMPDSVSSKENERSRCNSLKHERSPGRHKQQANESNASTSPTNKDHSKFEYDYPKKTLQSAYVDTKDFKKESPKMYNHDSSLTRNTSPSKDSLSSSPTSTADRWAGPAFGNAPPPSSLPLPEWTASTPIAVPQHHPVAFTTSPHGSYQLPSSGFTPLSASPPHYLPASPSHYMSPPAAPYISYSSIPAIPFPYVHSTAYTSPPQSLNQLSTDLRRLLNINVALDPILVANSS